ncbi:MAG TPA: pyruvate dehydrogenase (acetyl-transferring) E1 component subunit alpha [Candidatus Methylacidiphilales bacterium]|nr:pyruvate dehydrogenase (acetyl-transferring) E1 component subunit alpha [Candidatus Methylacidiphilales bacterium]
MPAADADVKNPKANGSSRLPDLQPQQKVALYRQMLLIRRFEEKARQAYTQLKIKGFCHLYNGQEAVAVGTISVLNPDDAVITAYRDHGHALVRGVDPNACMAELFGKITGCSRGKGGSMHFFDAQKHFYGGHGIVGGQVPLGAGLAFAQKYLGTNRVTLAYMGDGAINQGGVHEAMNLAALWKLPVIFIIENNEYSMGTCIARSSAGDPLTKRAGAFDMAAIQANGMDIDDVRAKTFEAVSLARTESQPTLMEIRTYRYFGHSMSDPGHYRTKEEIESRRKADPIEIYKARLLEQRAATEESLNAIDEETTAIAQAAYDFAEASPEPEVETVFEDIFTPEDQIPEFRPNPRG